MWFFGVDDIEVFDCLGGGEVDVEDLIGEFWCIFEGDIDFVDF